MGQSRETKLLKLITQAFKTLREEKHLSQGKVAVLAGISRPAISHIENADRLPTLLISLKIAGALGVELSDIIQEAEIKIKKQ